MMRSFSILLGASRGCVAFRDPIGAKYAGIVFSGKTWGKDDLFE